MIDWRILLTEQILSLVQRDEFWKAYLDAFTLHSQRGLHLGVFVEPYLRFIFLGKKTIESRFSMYRCAPYERVHAGDVILLKRSGGPIVGLAEVSEVWCDTVDSARLDLIKKEFGIAMCADDPDFWRAKERTSFATLIHIRNVRVIHPVVCAKRDRHGWVVLRDGTLVG